MCLHSNKKNPNNFLSCMRSFIFSRSYFQRLRYCFHVICPKAPSSRARQVPPELSPPRHQTATRAVPHLMLRFLPFLFLGQPDVIQLCERDDSSQLWLISEIWILILICIFMHKWSESTGFFFSDCLTAGNRKMQFVRNRCCWCGV